MCPAVSTLAEPTTLPFDQEQRYRLIGELLRVLSREGGPLSILDVGGRTGALRGYLRPEDRLVAVDPEASDVPGLILGAGQALPFADGAFDAVVAADTLEHVPPAERERFVRECCRVSRSWTVLAGPYHHPRVVEAERRLAEFVRARLGSHRYLNEHLALGLPRREEVEAWCHDAGARRVRVLGHGNLERWLGLMCATLLLDRDPATRGAARRLHRFYHQALLPEDHAGTVYRHAVVAVKNGPIPPPVEELLAPDDVDPRAEEALQHAITEILAFDAGRDVLDAERARLEDELARRDRDLAGHAAVLADQEAQLAQHRDGLRSVERDLAGHRAALRAARAEAAARAEEVRRVRAEAHAIQATLLRKTRLRRLVRRTVGRLLGFRRSARGAWRASPTA